MRIDNATLWQAFYHVALPLARPGIVVSVILLTIVIQKEIVQGLASGGVK